MFGRKASTTEAPLPPQPANGAPVSGAAGDGDEAIVPLWQPTASVARKSVEQLLLERGQITENHLVQARQLAAQTPGKSLAQLLLQMSAASEAQILAAQAETLGMAFEQPDKTQVDAQAYELLTPEYIRKQLVIPLRFDGKALVVGMSDPTNVFLIDDVRRRTKRDVRAVVTTA